MSPRSRRALILTVSVLFIWVIVFLYYRSRWSSFAAFASTMDHCDEVFCDFRQYFYVQGQTVLDSAAPIDGYFYSLPFALVLHVFGSLPIDAAAVAWAICQVFLALGLFAVSLALAELPADLRWQLTLTYALIFATSVPLLHNAAWGQVSVLLTFCIFLAIWLYNRGFRAGAAIVLALSITIKYYPAIFLLYFLLRRDWRTIGICLIGCLAMALVPAAILGPEKTMQFQLAVNRAVADAQQSWIPKDINAQFLPYVISRWAGEVASTGLARAISVAGYLLSAVVVALNVALLYAINARNGSKPVRWSVLLLFTMLPFLVPTSWPHYFAYLPGIQLFATVEVLQSKAGWRARSMNLLVGVMPSVLASSMLVFNRLGDWQIYSRYGLLLLANAWLIGLAYTQLTPNLMVALRKRSPGGATAG